MKGSNQHITFDDLLALNNSRLSLQKANQCVKHLEICEQCQNTLEAIHEFDTINLRQPHIQYADKELDRELLDITKQYIKKNQKNDYAEDLKPRFYNRWKYAMAASLLLLIGSSFILNNEKRTLAKKFESEFQIIAESDDDELKTDIYFDHLLNMVSDENMKVRIIRENREPIVIKFYNYYNRLNIKGGQIITNVKVLNINADGKASELIITERSTIKKVGHLAWIYLQ